MRNLPFCCAALLAVAAAPVPARDSAISASAAATTPITFTRAEIAAMTEEQLAARALAAIAAGSPSTRGGPNSSFFSPGASPWVGWIDVELPRRMEPGFCRRQILHLDLQPVAYEPARMSDPTYDPPAAISDVELRIFYADPGAGAANCPDPNDVSWFSAPDAQAAMTAIRAFRLFRREEAAGTLRNFSCRSDASEQSCRGARAGLADITCIGQVLWMDDQTVVLETGQTTRLRLTLDYRGSDASWRLIRTELILREPPPPV